MRIRALCFCYTTTMSATTVGFYATIGGFLTGVLVRSLLSVSPSIMLLLAMVSLALSIVYVVFRSSSHRVLVLGGCIFCLAAAFGIWRQDFAAVQLSSPALDAQVGETVTLTGTVVLPPDVRERTQHLYVASEGTRVLVMVDRYTRVAYGDTVVVSGELMHPESFTTEFGRTFRYPEYLLARGVTHTMRFPEALEVTASGQGHAIPAVLYRVKAWFQDSLRMVVPEPYAGLGEGILLGEKRALGAELTEAFRRSGIIHIVVLSGYNVMLVAGFFLFGLSFVFARRGRAFGGIIAILAFAIMVGFSPTVLRASIMASLVLVAFALGREYHVLRALLLAAAGMVAVNPYLLAFDPGFQLSFLATLGLIAVVPHLETWPLTTGVWPRLRALMYATIATQVAVLPLLLYQIGEFSLVAVAVNMLVIPVVPVAMLATFVAGVLAAVSFTLGSIAAYPAVLSLWYIITVASVSASLPYAAVTVPPFPFIFVVIGYGALIGTYLWWRYGAQRAPWGSSSATPLCDTYADWVVVEEATLHRETKNTDRQYQSVCLSGRGPVSRDGSPPLPS